MLRQVGIVVLLVSTLLFGAVLQGGTSFADDGEPGYACTVELYPTTFPSDDCVPTGPDYSTQSEYDAAVYYAQNDQPLGGCGQVISGSGSWAIHNIYYDAFGCEVPLRYGSAPNGWGYYHIVDRGRWHEPFLSKAVDAIAHPSCKRASDRSPTAVWYYYWLEYGGNARTIHVTVERSGKGLGLGQMGVITWYLKGGYVCEG